jgi:hypothetical protein
MLRQLRWVVACSVLCALAVPPAAAQRSLVIAGGVFEDRMSLAVRPHFLAAEGVTVKLYRGDRTPLATTKTNRAGMYVFQVAGPGEYVVTVDSATLHPEAWPEQTFGPAGSLCAHPERGTITTLYEGPCFGGRTTNGSDDASTLATAEHVAQVTVGESQTSVDFAFSFDVVTSTADAPRAQGTLRQYFLNANAKAGPNRMRFVPVSHAPEHPETTLGVPSRWWTVALGSPLPELRDDDTVVDGTPYNFVSPATAAQVHPGRFGEPLMLQRGESQVSRLRRPGLELVANGATAGIVCAGRCGLSSFALHGATTGIVTRADARIEHVLVGAAANGAPVAGGENGVVAEQGTLAAHHLLVTSQSQSGIVVGPEARLEAEHLDVSGCGTPLTGAGVTLLSRGSSIRSSVLASNAGAGVLLGSPDGKAPASGNVIDGSTISGNQAGVMIGPGSSRNVIMRNDIMWNRTGGVTVTRVESAAQPRENRISANRFDENGLRPIILDLEAEDPNALHPGAEVCAPAAILPAPRVTGVRLVDEGGILRAVIRGRACPGQIIELYQSYVTSGVREKAPALPRVRSERTGDETSTVQSRSFRLPSIGEFNYLGATNTNPEGEFEATFPVPVTTSVAERPRGNDDLNVWATQVLVDAAPEDRAFSAIAIDAAGNTSEMSIRRKSD